DGFWTRLADCGADSFGIIHWTTRPLDLYFKSLAGQVWGSTSNRSLRATCDDMAGRLFGPAARGPGGEYLSAWIDGAPIFGRDTTDFFIDRPFPPERVDATVAGCSNRLAILARIDATALPPPARERLDYFRRLEGFCADFFRAEGAHQAAVAQIRRGDRAAARARMPQVPPAGVIEQYAQLSSIGGITRGELGVLVTINLKWLPYVESVRQALGLQPVRIDFGPTSHEDAAQGAGTLTFHADAESNLWRVLGRRETGAAEFTASNVAIPGNVPVAWAEIAASGVESTNPLSFVLQPVPAPQKGGPLLLDAGHYRLSLFFADPSGLAPGQRVFEVVVQGQTKVMDALLPVPPPVDVDVVRDAGGPRRLLVKTFEVDLAGPGVVRVTLTPKTGKVLICGAILEPIGAGHGQPGGAP
ncbi:MAG: hypothetical protein KJ579_08195, partial [Verrucomicrobia bacterium]|nr:hypothetical protein [Verrucomicrobiota bacterium]